MLGVKELNKSSYASEEFYLLVNNETQTRIIAVAVMDKEKYGWMTIAGC